MRRSRFPHRTVLVLAVLAAVLGVPRALQPAAAPPGTVQANTVPAVTASAARSPSAVHADARRPVAAVTLAARQPVAPGGACSVPGIGDIGSLLGFCTLGQSGLTGDLNNICQPSLPDPEPANAGIDSLVRPPASSGAQPTTLYGSYGVAGQFWASTNLQCSDMTSLIGDNVASVVFDIAKSIDRVTITVYQAAAGEGILSWLTSVVDKLISTLGNAIYFPYLAAIVLIGAIWLAWQGLIRRRGTRTIEGTIWMVVACVAAIWLIGRPADFTGMGTAVSNGMSQALNTAFAKLPAPSQSNCLPVSHKDPQVQSANFNFESGNGIVAENANELWTVLVCKPWLAGEFGTTAFGTSGSSQTAVNTYGRQLLWAQAIATNETPSASLIQAKQATYQGIATSIQHKDPGIYPLFQGKQWTTRLEIAFAALFAAAIAGVLVLLIAVTLILLKLGFLLLLVVGPFFLLIGTHPGFGRVVALRWFEMLVGVLLKMAAVSLVLSVLLYAYTLIMGTSDAVLPWALKILMIALVTVAVFIYRKPFQHLFSAVGYGMIGSRERADHAVANRGEQVLERPAVDEDRDGYERDHEDLQRPRERRVAGAHDQRVGVEQHAEHERDRPLLEQHADEHLEPAHRDHPSEAGMRADQQEERPHHKQQQEAQLQQDQRDRDQQHQDAGDRRGEQGGERDLQPRRPLLALEQRVDPRIPLLDGCRDTRVGGLLGLDQRGRRILVGGDGLRP